MEIICKSLQITKVQRKTIMNWTQFRSLKQRRAGEQQQRVRLRERASEIERRVKLKREGERYRER